jgi:hypothetical protein
MIVSHQGKTRGDSRLVITAAITLTGHRAILIEIAGTSPREPGAGTMRFFAARSGTRASATDGKMRASHSCDRPRLAILPASPMGFTKSYAFAPAQSQLRQTLFGTTLSYRCSRLFCSTELPDGGRDTLGRWSPGALIRRLAVHPELPRSEEGRRAADQPYRARGGT